MYDLIIIGAGPAGMSAAVYAARAELNFIVIEGSMMQGGQVLTTYDVDNYLGLPGIGGFEMGMKFAEHANKLGVNFVTENVVSMDVSGDVKKVVTDKNTYETRTIIIATGAVHRKAGIPGEAEFTGKGVSYCATCDGAFFKNKVAAVVGGGDVAVEDAIYLARMCSKVYLISSIQIKNKKTGEVIEKPVDGVFFAVGMQPVTSFVDDSIKMDEAGYIVAGEDCRTNIDGVYAAGDIRTKNLRQIITAAADGANAVTSVERYIG